MLATVSPETLAIPERILKLIPPQPAAYERTQESFVSYTGPTFDPVGAAQTAAQMTLGLLLEPQRAARLAIAPSGDARQLGLAEVIDRVWQATWKAPPTVPALARVRAIVDEVALATVIDLVTSADASPAVRSVAYGKLPGSFAWATPRRRREAKNYRRPRARAVRARADSQDRRRAGRDAQAFGAGGDPCPERRSAQDGGDLDE